MNFWSYLLTPTGPTLGPVALQGIFVGLLLMIGGVALITVPREIQRHRSSTNEHPKGVRERAMRAEFRVKVGAMMTSWGGAFTLSLLLRLLNTPGLDTRFLSALVVLALLGIVSYGVLYRLLFYTRYISLAQRMDQQSHYLVTTKKQKKQTSVAKEQPINLLAGKTLIVLVAVPLIYFIGMVPVAIPNNLPASNHDHLLHQSGMLVMSLIGYALGLLLTLGDDMRERARWISTNR